MSKKGNSQTTGVAIHSSGDTTIEGNVVGRDNITVNNYNLSLEPIREFLNAILGEPTQEKLKSAGAEKIARSRVFQLYQVLGEVNEKTDAFVEALSVLIDPGAPPTEAERLSQRDTLSWAAQELMQILPELAEALDEVNPQLDIHQHELVKQIKAYRASRALVLTELEQSSQAIFSEQPESLQRILVTARQNRELISKATDALRDFLKEQFPFKESFE
jgi:hypothetical protein